MKNLVFAALAAAFIAVSLAPAAGADGWDSTPVAPGNDPSSTTGYRPYGPQGGQPQETLSGFTGSPADQLPVVSPGANPYVPLGPGH